PSPTASYVAAKMLGLALAQPLEEVLGQVHFALIGAPVAQVDQPLGRSTSDPPVEPQVGSQLTQRALILGLLPQRAPIAPHLGDHEPSHYASDPSLVAQRNPVGANSTRGRRWDGRLAATALASASDSWRLWNSLVPCGPAIHTLHGRSASPPSISANSASRSAPHCRTCSDTSIGDHSAPVHSQYDVDPCSPRSSAHRQSDTSSPRSPSNDTFM